MLLVTKYDEDYGCDRCGNQATIAIYSEVRGRKNPVNGIFLCEECKEIVAQQLLRETLNFRVNDLQNRVERALTYLDINNDSTLSHELRAILAP